MHRLFKITKIHANQFDPNESVLICSKPATTVVQTTGLIYACCNLSCLFRFTGERSQQRQGLWKMQRLYTVRVCALRQYSVMLRVNRRACDSGWAGSTELCPLYHFPRPSHLHWKQELLHRTDLLKMFSQFGCMFLDSIILTLRRMDKAQKYWKLSPTGIKIMYFFTLENVQIFSSGQIYDF